MIFLGLCSHKRQLFWINGEGLLELSSSETVHNILQVTRSMVEGSNCFMLTGVWAVMHTAVRNTRVVRYKWTRELYKVGKETIWGFVVEAEFC